ncbi:hypothetical protein OQA88_5511 [Cercophora sp. LCS_1]
MDELSAFSQTAYAAEMAHDWTRAHNLHESAITKWSEFSNTTIMASARQDHYRRMAVLKCALHQERIEVIGPFAKQGKPIPNTILVHPSAELMKRGVWDQLDLEAEPLSPDELQKKMPLTLQELKTPQRPIDTLPEYTPTVLTTNPMTTYKMSRTASTMPNNTHTHIVVTLKDATKSHTLLILEAIAGKSRSSIKITESWVYRPADYPHPAYTLTPGKTATSRMWEHFPILTRIHDLDLPWVTVHGLTTPILETPDRAFITQIWNTSRFVFGGRRFVSKPRKQNKSGWIISDSDAVHEYTKSWPVKGSKTGKLEDDARRQVLWKFSVENVWAWTEANWVVSVAEGLDPVLNEYLCATRMFRLAAGRNGAGVSVLAAAAGEGRKVGEPRGLEGKLEVIEAGLEAGMAVVEGVVNLEGATVDVDVDVDVAGVAEASAVGF